MNIYTCMYVSEIEREKDRETNCRKRVIERKRHIERTREGKRNTERMNISISACIIL